MTDFDGDHLDPPRHLEEVAVDAAEACLELRGLLDAAARAARSYGDTDRASQLAYFAGQMTDAAAGAVDAALWASGRRHIHLEQLRTRIRWTGE